MKSNLEYKNKYLQKQLQQIGVNVIPFTKKCNIIYDIKIEILFIKY